MAMPNAVQGGTRPSLLITWLQDGTTTPEVLTSATLTGTIGNAIGGGGTVRAITGTLTVTSGAAGIFRWDLSAADVASAGTFEVQFSAAFGSGQTPAKTFLTRWTVDRSQSV
jgi:hypothetical protein